MISCILLSAGLSSRWGSPKALVKFKGTTLIEHHQYRLLKTDIGEIIVVLGAAAKEIAPFLIHHQNIKSVDNSDYLLGQTSSVKTALRHVSVQVSGIMVLPVDVPFVQIATFNLLIKNFYEDSSAIIIPCYKNIKGHPPIFPARMKEEILALDNTMGLNALLQSTKHKIRILPVDDPGIVSGFNTQEEWKSLLVAFDQSRKKYP